MYLQFVTLDQTLWVVFTFLEKPESLVSTFFYLTFYRGTISNLFSSHSWLLNTFYWDEDSTLHDAIYLHCRGLFWYCPAVCNASIIVSGFFLNVFLFRFLIRSTKKNTINKLFIVSLQVETQNNESFTGAYLCLCPTRTLLVYCNCFHELCELNLMLILQKKNKFHLRRIFYMMELSQFLWSVLQCSSFPNSGVICSTRYFTN